MTGIRPIRERRWLNDWQWGWVMPARVTRSFHQSWCSNPWPELLASVVALFKVAGSNPDRIYRIIQLAFPNITFGDRLNHLAYNDIYHSMTVLHSMVYINVTLWGITWKLLFQDIQLRAAWSTTRPEAWSSDVLDQANSLWKQNERRNLAAVWSYLLILHDNKFTNGHA